LHGCSIFQRPEVKECGNSPDKAASTFGVR
jgi:hypothetical protein